MAALRPVGITDSQMGRMAAALKTHPEVLDDVVSAGQVRKDMVEHNARTLDQVSQPTGVSLASGGMFEWQIASPVKLVKMFLESCPVYSEMFKRTTAAHINSGKPLSILLYHDEFTPGQVLKPDNKRKTTCFYFTFLEFGDFIRSEFAWLPCACLRHTTAALLDGEMSSDMFFFWSR